ncbi:hypothetical protein [Alcaligenes aquatilis]|uniref:hypothetical protein n=1 Tax=Alcaligenes aquatilis TaxID=323284 RepID=UPI0037526AAA
MANPRKPSALKVIAGTDRPDRKGDDPVDLPLVEDVPAAPGWLPNTHAEAEWDRLARILFANRLLTEASLTSLAHLCALDGKIKQLYAAGETPTASMVAQLRAYQSEFGLTPVAQGKVKPVEREAAGNKFAGNGRKRAS